MQESQHDSVPSPPGGPGDDPTQRLPRPDADATLASFHESPAAPPPPAAPQLPERIGNYRIEGELGRGGMGVVYLARDPSLERLVALKVLPERLARDAQALALFLREAKLLAAVNTPNIATIHTLEEDQGVRFLTMELIPGSSLAERIRDRSTPIPEWLGLCRQVAVALEVAHRNGIVHLDLKPQNIMVTPDGGVKVLDFGLAMAMGTEAEVTEEARTRAGSQEAISGTPGYMGPEQLRGQAVDSRTDIWAFGCILYECLTGSSAFPGSDAIERARATLETTPDLDALPDGVAPRIREVLRRCLTREVDGRLDTITKARRELEEEIALGSLPAAVPRTETTPNNLPMQLTSFVGRERPKAEVAGLLDEHRLVTLTGVGGGGKTRLSLEIGRERLATERDGVWFVELAPVVSPELVPGAIAASLRLRDVAGLSPLDVLQQHLRDRSALLLLDNCEHLLQAVATVAETLLETCPRLRILATSREGLGVRGEVTYHVPSLSIPSAAGAPGLEELRGMEAVQLFEARAKAVLASFALTPANAAAVAQICRRLDGIPLALELAAARIKVLPVEEIAKRLDNRFRLLTSSSRTSLPRHQTLQALIDWSYDQLSASEQALLRHLSLFAGGWTLDAAETICAGEGIEGWEVLDLLSSLVGKSLVETDAEVGQGMGLARYRMLETIRDYARARLAGPEEGSEMLVRHRAYFVALAEEAAPRLTGPEQAVALQRLAAENDNLRLALDMCNVIGADPELGWRLGAALGRFWYLRGQWNEGRLACSMLLERPDALRASAAAADTLNWAGNLAKLQGDYARARQCLEESLAIRRGLGEDLGIASSLNNLANVLKDQGDYEQARVLYEESLRLQRRLQNKGGIAVVLNSLGVLTHLLRDYAASVAFHEESLGLRRGFGDRSGIAASLNNLGTAADALGDRARATECLEESLAIQRELKDRWGVAASLTNLGRLAEDRGEDALARSFYEESLATFRDLGDRRGAAACLNNLGMLTARGGDRAAARRLFQESLTILKELEAISTMADVMTSLGWLEAEEGNAARAGRLIGAAEVLLAAAGKVESAALEGQAARALLHLPGSEAAQAFRDGRAEGRAMSPGQAPDAGLEATE